MDVVYSSLCLGPEVLATAAEACGGGDARWYCTVGVIGTRSDLSLPVTLNVQNTKALNVFSERSKHDPRGIYNGS